MFTLNCCGGSDEIKKWIEEQEAERLRKEKEEEDANSSDDDDDVKAYCNFVLGSI